MRLGRSLRIAAVLIALAAAGCGQKGPPLAPYVRVPAAVATVTPQRVGSEVYLTFEVPSTNADGQKPAAIGELQVYAVTSEKPPETEEQREVATLVAAVPVRPILPPLPPLPEGVPPPPPLPLPPGVDQGTAVTVKETLTPEAFVAVELPDDTKPPEPDDTAVIVEPFGPLVAPAATQMPRRHYFVIGISARGREGAPSAPVSIPLEPVSSAPGAPAIAHTATEMTITWAPPADARSATIPPPPTVKPVPAGANATPADATPGNTTPKAPPPLPLLQAKSLGFNSQATTYNVYDVTPANATPAAPVAPDAPVAPAEPNPFALTQPTPLNPLPVADAEFVITTVAFDVERCFQVRPVDQVFGTAVIGPASPTTCITPKDTFPPAAPRSLAAIAGSGVINLIWDPNTESDLAGYIVLRGEAPGDTLQPITPEPVAATTYRDETVRPGTRYFYAVVAVDRAVPPNVSPQSNRAEETARQ
jgi:predicted small lipoprotein YifL